MKTNVVSLPARATIHDAAQTEIDHKVGTLPVVDELSQLVGVSILQFPEMEPLRLMTFLISIPLLPIYSSRGVISHSDRLSV